MTIPNAFFVPAGVGSEGHERVTATEHTVSLWAPTMQHGAPPSALLVRALERVDAREDTRISRVAVDILGPVPVGDIEIRAWTERPGTNIELVVAELWAAGASGTARAVARGSAWRMRTTPTDDVTHSGDPVMRPVSDGVDYTFGGTWSSGYLDAVEFKILTGLGEDGPGEIWARPTPVLVQGESMTSLERLFSIADIANGIGAKLPIDEWTFLNTDLTVHVFRVPQGEWVGVSAETSTGPDGIAMCAGTLSDKLGPVGRIAQTVLVRRRT
ncbi:thioesterase family protein [Rhodococcus sp. 05-339-2]|uniref:thioesterase family protein n=1 Tax=Rhodococcoides fascians TaxID=1828 RepID=UPI0009E8004C|nr:MULTISPECIES: thioesterase family protein [Rhodococcus]OZD77522.1 thioesterase family protein [Rhodococcus sp. 05-339-2]